jgi:hypothetical protein
MFKALYKGLGNTPEAWVPLDIFVANFTALRNMLVDIEASMLPAFDPYSLPDALTVGDAAWSTLLAPTRLLPSLAVTVHRLVRSMHGVCAPTLLYVATRDGWDIETFMTQTLTHKRLLVLARASGCFWFGGYSAPGFVPYSEDDSAYVFTLTNPSRDRPTVFRVDMNRWICETSTSFSRDTPMTMMMTAGESFTFGQALTFIFKAGPPATVSFFHPEHPALDELIVLELAEPPKSARSAALAAANAPANLELQW